jgi:hypothetical protein
MGGFPSIRTCVEQCCVDRSGHRRSRPWPRTAAGAGDSRLGSRQCSPPAWRSESAGSTTSPGAPQTTRTATKHAPIRARPLRATGSGRTFSATRRKVQHAVAKKTMRGTPSPSGALLAFGTRLVSCAFSSWRTMTGCGRSSFDLWNKRAIASTRRGTARRPRGCCRSSATTWPSSIGCFPDVLVSPCAEICAHVRIGHRYSC